MIVFLVLGTSVSRLSFWLVRLRSSMVVVTSLNVSFNGGCTGDHNHCIPEPGYS